MLEAFSAHVPTTPGNPLSTQGLWCSPTTRIRYILSLTVFFFYSINYLLLKITDKTSQNREILTALFSNVFTVKHTLETKNLNTASLCSNSTRSFRPSAGNTAFYYWRRPIAITNSSPTNDFYHARKPRGLFFECLVAWICNPTINGYNLRESY